jgi:hypothetical protein
MVKSPLNRLLVILKYHYLTHLSMKKLYLPILAMGILLSACQKDKESVEPLVINELNGYVQKGPFISGTNLLVSELNPNLGQTGKTFTAIIKDDQGAFSLQDIKLTSKYIDLRANGFYFNEVSGKLSGAPLSLAALADVTNAASVNVNLLTHLEKSRVEYLMRTEKKSFDAAKKQAQGEILAIFNISKSHVANSEQLNITQSGEDNAILLAISAILQAKRTESELTELLSKISLDIEKDGNLDNTTLQSAILDEAYLLDQKSVRTNIVKRYSELGVSVSPADFEKHINNFIQKSTFTFTKAIQYPAATSTGINLLSSSNAVIVVPKSDNYHWYNNPAYQTSFKMAAMAPAGTTVKVRIITLAVPDNSYAAFSCYSTGPWKYTYNYDAPLELTLNGTGEISEATFSVRLTNESMRRRIEVYENNATKPTLVREITFVGDNSPSGLEKIEYPHEAIHGLNVLDSYDRTSDQGQVSMLALVPSANKVKVKVTLNAKLDIVYTNGNWYQVSHQVIDNFDIYEFETVNSGVKAHNNLKVIYDDRTSYMRAPKAIFEVYENNSTTPVKIKEFDWYR